MGRQGGVRIGCTALVADDDAVLDLDDPVGPFLEPGIVSDADHRRAMLGRGATQQADDNLSVLAVQG